MTAGYELSAAARRHGSRPALIVPDASLSFSEVEERTNSLADGLRSHGVRPGDRVVIWLENGLELAETFFALEKAGAVAVPLDRGEPGAKVARVVRALEAATLFCPGGSVAEVADGLPGRARMVACGPLPPTEVPQTRVVLRYADLAAQGLRRFPGVEVQEDSPLRLMVRMAADDRLLTFTHTYRTWGAGVRLQLLLYAGGYYGPRLGDDEVFLHVQQLLYGTGRMGLYPMFLLGYPQVILPRFTALDALQAVERHRVTGTFMVPGMVERVVAELERGTVGASGLRRLLYGGAPLSREALLRSARLLGARLVQLYGRAEAAWPIAILSPEDHLRLAAGDHRLAGSCGRPVPFVEFRLGAAAAGQAENEGVIRVRSESVAPACADPEGWCDTTDIARQDEDGYLYILGRSEEMINTGSYHVYPQEIEDALRTHPAVQEVRVGGVPDPRWGEAVKAWVVLRPDVRPSDSLRAELLAACRRGVAAYKVPKAIDFVAGLDAAHP